MSSGAICPVCDRHYVPPECRCGYLEGPRAEGRLTRVSPRRRATDEVSFTQPVREALQRMAPDQVAMNRDGIRDARAELDAARERLRLRTRRPRPVENVNVGGRL